MSVKGFRAMFNKVRFVAVVLAALVICLLPTTTRAAEPLAGGQGIQISPVLIDLNAEKSQNYTLKITVTNITAGELILKSSVVDFGVKNESGAPAILPENESNNATYSFKNWVSPLSDFKLASKESRQVNVRVNIPEDAEAGGHYGIIRFSGVPPNSDKNVSLIASVGVLVLTRVEGNITEQLAVKQIYIEKSGKKKVLAEGGPLTIVDRIENTGNVHVKPSGLVTVKNFFGSTVASLPLSSEPKNVLPHSIRRFEQSLPKTWLFGRYTVSLNANYGTTGKTLTGSTSFWVIPYRIMAVVLVVLATAIWLGYQAVKRYNARIIKRHRQSKK